MSATKFIPSVWNARLLNALEPALVYGELFNRDYEGDIAEQGDTVHIGQIGNIAVKKFTCGSPIDDPDDVSVNDETMKIDQADYFNFAVCDVDKVQSAANLLDSATQNAGFQFATNTDKYLGTVLATAGKQVGAGTKVAPTLVTEANAYKLITELKTFLDKANLPQADRKVVVPPEFEALMLLDPRFVQVGTDASNDRLESGTIYRAAGLEIRVSNNCPTFKHHSSKTGFQIVASSKLCATFADQILKTEPYRPEKGFKDAVKGLHVYGAKVTRPNAVGVLNITFEAGE